MNITFDYDQITQSLRAIRQNAGPGQAGIILRAIAFSDFLEKSARRFHSRRQTALDRNWKFLTDATLNTLMRDVFASGPRHVPPPGASFFFGVEPIGKLLNSLGYTPDLDSASYFASLFDGHVGSRNFPDYCAVAIYFAPIAEFRVFRIVTPPANINVALKALGQCSASLTDWTTLAPQYAAIRP